MCSLNFDDSKNLVWLGHQNVALSCPNQAQAICRPDFCVRRSEAKYRFWSRHDYISMSIRKYCLELNFIIPVELLRLVIFRSCNSCSLAFLCWACKNSYT